jgi:hypothetical protein
MIKEFVYNDLKRKIAVFKITPQYIEGVSLPKIEELLKDEKNKDLRDKYISFCELCLSMPLQQEGDIQTAERNPSYDNIIQPFIKLGYRRYALAACKSIDGTQKQIKPSEVKMVMAEDHNIIVHIKDKQYPLTAKEGVSPKLAISNLINELKIDPAGVQVIIKKLIEVEEPFDLSQQVWPASSAPLNLFIKEQSHLNLQGK